MDSETGPKTFRYPELSTTVPAIRLMSFASGCADTSLEYTLESFELNSLPPFTALSYTWGDPFRVEDDSEGIDSSDIWDQSNHLAFCNQQPVQLRKNLYEALQTIKQRDDRPTYVWVDAICINQLDDDERSSQVGLMSDIYGRADLVIAWLGSELESSEKAEALLYTFGTGISNMIRRDGWEKVSKYGPTTPQLVEELGHLLPQESDWIAWNSFFHRSWFSRTWVLQEAALAKRLVLLSGNHAFDFDDITLFNNYAVTAPWWPMRAPNYCGEKLPREITIPIVNTRHMFQGGLTLPTVARQLEGLHGAVNQGSVLLRVLSLARGFKSSNRLDKVYGNLGIIRRVLGDEFDESVLRPNYNISVSDLCLRVASYILTTVPILSLLSHVEETTEGRSHSLPSWVPDFGINHAAGKQVRFGNTIEPLENDRPLYSTTLTNSDIPSTRSVEGNVLFINGYHLSTTTEVAVGDPNLHSADEFINQLQLVSGLPATYINGQSRFESYWRTFLGNIVPKGSEPAIAKSFTALIIQSLLSQTDLPPEELIVRLEKAFQHLAGLDSALAQRLRSLDNPSLDSLPENIPAFVSRCTNPQFRAELWAALANVSLLFLQTSEFSGKALLRTENGYLGLGPRRTKEGDQIWVIEQARVPFVLRPIPETDYFQLVGECYIHGIMNGELLGSIQFVKIGLA